MAKRSRRKCNIKCDYCGEYFTYDFKDYLENGKYFEALNKYIKPKRCTGCFKKEYNKNRFCTSSHIYLKWVYGLSDDECKNL